MPLSPSGSGHADDLGRSEGREAVHQGDAYLDFRSLTVWVSGGDTLTESFEAPHLCLDPASDVVSGPALPECPAIVPGGTQGFVSSDCSRYLSKKLSRARSFKLRFRRALPWGLLRQPDQQRPALAKRSRVDGPVRRAVAGG